MLLLPCTSGNALTGGGDGNGAESVEAKCGGGVFTTSGGKGGALGLACGVMPLGSSLGGGAAARVIPAGLHAWAATVNAGGETLGGAGTAPLAARCGGGGSAFGAGNCGGPSGEGSIAHSE